jgi:hypothetical protein
MSAAAATPLTERVLDGWYRTVGRKRPAHWYDRGEACRYAGHHGQPVPPSRVPSDDMTVHGEPFGSVCPYCVPRFRARSQ